MSVLLSIATGCAAMGLVLPAWKCRPHWAGWAWLLGLGTAAGIGLHSFLYFLLLWAGVASGAVLLGFEFALCAAAAALAWRFRNGPEMAAPEGGFRYAWVLALAAAAVLLLVAAAVWISGGASPHGDWDAWSIWNPRAKFLAGPAESWRHAVSPLAGQSHPDYPLLTSSYIASLWRLSGGTAPDVPRLLGLLWTACAAAILAGALAAARGLSAALLGLLTLSASAGYLAQAPAQYADIPMSVFVLGALSLATLRQDGRALAAAGFLASCAAWTKNEGLVFAGILLACGLWALGWRPWRWMLAGAAPGLAVVAAFKLLLAPPSEFAQQAAGAVAAKLVDPGRWLAIVEALAREIRDLGIGIANPVLMVAILVFGLRLDPSANVRLPAVALGAQFGAYLGAYLVTPANLPWQLSTSFGRLLAQIWPAVLFTLFVKLRRLEDFTPPARSRGSALPTRSAKPPGSAGRRRSSR